MLILRAIEIVFCFLALCITACSVGMFFLTSDLVRKKKIS